MSDYAHIALEEADGVATLTIRRPEVLNALARTTLAELNDAVARVAASATARALLLTGEGRAFCAGADLAAAGRDYAGSDDRGLPLETGFNPLAEALAALPVPIVVAVNGAAAGAGCSYALGGDIVFAARSAYFVMSFAQIGLVPDAGATWLLPRLAGSARARAMLLLGGRVSADQAEAWGMIFAAVDDDALMPAARAMAARLAAGPTIAYGLIRRGLDRAAGQGFTETLAMEREHQRLAGLTADHAEGVAAFLARRPPRFTGR